MKKKYFLALLLIGIMILPSVFSSQGVACTSSEPAKIPLHSWNFANHAFEIVLQNGANGNMQNVAAHSESKLILSNAQLPSLVKPGETIELSGTYLEGIFNQDKISISYLSPAGQEKGFVVTCSGVAMEGMEAQAKIDSANTLTVYFFCFCLFVLGICLAVFGYRKGKDKTRNGGLMLLILSLVVAVLNSIAVVA